MGNLRLESSMSRSARSEPTAKPAMSVPAVVLLVTVLCSCAIYANLSLLVRNPAAYRYFPPFRPKVNANHNYHLGGENINIATSLVAGEGFAHPFNDGKTGPTAWMPPVLPVIQAVILWASGGSRAGVQVVVVCLQGISLIATGLLLSVVVARTTKAIWGLAAAAVFLLAVVGDFRLWFQFTHDHWIVLLAMDGLILGLCLCRPLESRGRAACWGLCGGLCALINPIVGLAWGVLSAALMVRERAWRQYGIAVLLAGATITPWMVRNYLVFGRLIPVKSNLAFEMYQAQCRAEDGLVRNFHGHPYHASSPDRGRYVMLGEMAFLDEKSTLFWNAVWADPLSFADRVAQRFLAATLWYVPFNRQDATARPWVVWSSRLAHPLPILALLYLAFSMTWRRLPWAQGCVMGLYGIYLAPYVVASYYERYAMPLLAVKVLLVLWAADRLLCWIRGLADYR